MAKKAKGRKAKKAAGASIIDTGRYQYETVKVRDAEGKLRHSRSNQDAVANAMLLFTSGGGDLGKVVRANKLTEKMAPHEGKQAGLYRMVLGSTLRGLVRNGTPVVIGDITVKKLDQNVKVPEAKVAAKKAAPRTRRKSAEAAAA